MRRGAFHLGWSGAAVLCGGCADRPASVPKVEVPAAWTAQSSQHAAEVTRDWFRQFQSDELDALVESAYRSSFDLQAADARVRQADARARAAGAAILPQVDVNADAIRYAGHSANGTARETDYGALISASYEVDFWGKNHAARESALASREATASDRSVVALTLVSGVVDGYFQVVALHERVDLARASLGTARDVLAAIEARNGVGAATPVELAQQRGAVAAEEIHLRELVQQEDEGKASIAILVGRQPGELRIAAQRLSQFSLPAVAPGLPSDLLLRRPDLLAAQESLQAAHADLLQARAAFFPSISLTASGGIQNPAVQAAVMTLTGTGPTVTAGAAIVQTIFSGGRLRAARDEASAKEEELVARYRAATLAALWDVERALSVIARLNEQEPAQLESVRQTERALDGARARYEEGAGDYRAVLDSERSVMLARDQMSQYTLARLKAVVSLCKALGGGWAPSKPL